MNKIKDTFNRQSNRPQPPTISMDSLQAFKDRLIEHYQNDPKFHTIVEKFHYSVRNGNITFDALFGAVFLAKEIFICEREDMIRDDEKWENR